MNYYLVDLNISVCGFDKVSSLLCLASDEEKAGNTAMILECHDMPDGDVGCAYWDDGCLVDGGDTFTYSVHKVQKLDHDLGLKLSRYMTVFLEVDKCE